MEEADSNGSQSNSGSGGIVPTSNSAESQVKSDIQPPGQQTKRAYKKVSFYLREQAAYNENHSSEMPCDADDDTSEDLESLTAKAEKG